MTRTVSACREAFVQKDAQTVREALAYLFNLAELHDIGYGCPTATRTTATQHDDALAALDRLEELAT